MLYVPHNLTSKKRSWSDCFCACPVLYNFNSEEHFWYIIGPIPKLPQLINLVTLDLRDNQLTGMFCVAPVLHTFDFEELFCSILGLIPKELSQLTNLKFLCLENNKLTGMLYSLLHTFDYEELPRLLQVPSHQNFRRSWSCSGSTSNVTSSVVSFM